MHSLVKVFTIYFVKRQRHTRPLAMRDKVCFSFDVSFKIVSRTVTNCDFSSPAGRVTNWKYDEYILAISNSYLHESNKLSLFTLIKTFFRYSVFRKWGSRSNTLCKRRISSFSRVTCCSFRAAFFSESFKILLRYFTCSSRDLTLARNWVSFSFLNDSRSARKTIFNYSGRSLKKIYVTIFSLTALFFGRLQ